MFSNRGMFLAATSRPDSPNTSEMKAGAPQSSQPREEATSAEPLVTVDTQPTTLPRSPSPTSSLFHFVDDAATVSKLDSLPRKKRRSLARSLVSGAGTVDDDEHTGYGYPKKHIDDVELEEQDEWKRPLVAYIERLIERFPERLKADDANALFDFETPERAKAYVSRCEKLCCRTSSPQILGLVMQTVANRAEQLPRMKGAGQMMGVVLRENADLVEVLDCKYAHRISGLFGPEMQLMTAVFGAMSMVYAANRQLEYEEERAKRESERGTAAGSKA